MRTVRALLAAWPMAASIAQGTYLVDLANGPGTHFTQIAAAVAAVPEDSILLVRAGNYAAVDIDGKAVTVLADAQVTVPTLQVRNTAANQRVVVRGVGATSGGRIEVLSAAGLVLLDAVGSTMPCTLRVAAAAQVVVRNSSFRFGSSLSPSVSYPPAVEVAMHAQVVFESCQMAGRWGENWFGNLVPPSAALEVGVDGTPCRVQTTACTLFGGLGGHYGSLWLQIPYYGSPAVRLGGGSSLRACGQAAHGIAAGIGPLPPPDAIVGIGSARVHPAIPVIPVPAAGGTVSFTRPELASVVASGGALGGVLAVERHGASGVLFALALSLPGAPTPWVTPPDPLWLHLPSVSLVAFGIAPAGPFQTQVPVPMVAGLLGWTVFWQAIDFEPAGGMPLSNPSAVVLR